MVELNLRAHADIKPVWVQTAMSLMSEDRAAGTTRRTAATLAWLCGAADHLCLDSPLGHPRGCFSATTGGYRGTFAPPKHRPHSHWQEKKRKITPAESHQNGPVCVWERKRVCGAMWLMCITCRKKGQTKLSPGNKYLLLRAKGEKD